MRRLLTRAAALTTAVVLCVLSATAVTGAETLPPNCRRAETGIVCDGKAITRERPVRPLSVTPTTAYPYRELWRPVLRPHPDGGTCLDTETVRLGREPSATEDFNSEMQFLRLLRSYSICPDAVLPTTTPQIEAAAFLERVALPTPQPHVAPGRLPVGFRAYLETNAPTTQTFTTDTPFGPLVLTATAEIYVDWDDPHDDIDGWEGPMSGQPGPYPDGGITHLYQYDGLYQIAVRYAWTATWSIGDVSGTIDGVETTGTYPAPGFEAYSRQAVG